MLQEAIKAHHGLRVLRQESWECLASFIASSSKQIVQIRQIVAELARQFGEPIETPWGMFHTFPDVSAIARASHKQLWDCKLGFRAKYLLGTARLIDSGKVNLSALPAMELERAVEELTKLPGVGEKIAGCALLFSCGFDQAFPIDVWIERALRRLYFPPGCRSDFQSRPGVTTKRPIATGSRSYENSISSRQLREFTRTHFGPYAGWAQQYLFFNERTRGRQPLVNAGTQ